MANLYNVPLENGVQLTTQNALLTGETTTITFTASVTSKLQASADIPGILVIDRVDANGNETPTKTEYISFTGVTGSTVTGLVRGLANSTDQDHSAGAIVEFVPDVVWADAINDVFTEQHNADGTHKSLSNISLASSTLNYPVINNPTISGGSLASTTILTSNIDTFSFKNINAPEGFLVNGKIVPSVASDNLTVAIKTMAGNDPSASDPIYVRIGDTVRTITSALSSVTTNAGTNWLNMGSSELATKEVDLFCYLQWNTTANAINILISRIPYANLMGDFPNSGIVDKGVFGIVNYNATDVVVNIGRFAATLSAGAGYTWTVPTFDASNLIQRPIFETRRLSYQPAYSAGAGMTFTSVTTSLANYKISNRTLFAYISANGTTGGTANNIIYATIPMEVFNVSFLIRGGCSVADGGTSKSGFYFADSLLRIGFVKDDGSNYGLGASREIFGTIIADL